MERPISPQRPCQEHRYTHLVNYNDTHKIHFVKTFFLKLRDFFRFFSGDIQFKAPSRCMTINEQLINVRNLLLHKEMCYVET